jgi:hypothetical protein
MPRDSNCDYLAFVVWVETKAALREMLPDQLSNMLTLIAYRFATDNQLPRLPYMTRLDAFILMGLRIRKEKLIEPLHRQHSLCRNFSDRKLSEFGSLRGKPASSGSIIDVKTFGAAPTIRTSIGYP